MQLRIGMRVRLTDEGYASHRGCTGSKLFLDETGVITTIDQFGDYKYRVTFHKSINHTFKERDLIPVKFTEFDFEL